MKNDVGMLGLGLTADEIELFEQNRIEYKKKFASIIKKARAESKNSQCYICGKDCSSFCNSHSIPRFCLKNIASKGHLFYSGNLVDLPMLDKQKGLNEAGTFRIICNDCDGKVFSDYENPDNYSQKPTDKMLSQIAMKNYLKSISKREVENSLYKNIAEMTGNDLTDAQTINTLDLNEYVSGFEYAKKACQSKWDNNYYLCYYEKVDYVVPLAFQNNISLIVDLEGGVINDIYNPSSEYVLKDIHVCVFPLENHSVVMMFHKNGENRYRTFLKQFKKLSAHEKLEVINYITFSYSEDVFLYRDLDETVLNHEGLKTAASQTTIAVADSPFSDPLASARKTFDLNKRSTIPNLFDVMYKVK